MPMAWPHRRGGVSARAKGKHVSGPGITAMRLRRPRWKDPRLLVGIVLVLISVLLGSLLVSRLAATTPVLVARGDVVIGDPLEAEDFTVAEVRLGDQRGLYADAPSDIPDGAVASRSVTDGEMLPLAAIGQSADVPLRPVVIAVDAAVAESVAPGGRVELWHTPTSRQEAPAAAEQLVEGGVVRRVDTGSSLGMRSMTVEVLVPADDVAPVLEALAQGDRVDVIGVPGASGVSS